jgi:arsenite methyltransferase
LQNRLINIALSICLFLMYTFAVAQNNKRDAWQQPEKIMDAIGLKPGMNVGEAGAGSGYFTFKLAARVGPKGIVYANDIDRNALNKLKKEAQRKKICNIKIIEGQVDNPLFPDSLDMVIMVYVLHHLDKPLDFFKNMAHSLKKGAHVVLVERDPQKDKRASGHFWQSEKILQKIEEISYQVIKVETFLKRDNIYILKPKKYQ